MSSTVKVLVVPVDGPPRVEDVPAAEGMLEALQKLVGGYIEPVRLGDGAIMLVNEDGLRLGLPFNPRVGAMLEHFELRAHPIVGTVVVVGTSGSSFIGAPARFLAWGMMGAKIERRMAGWEGPNRG